MKSRFLVVAALMAGLSFAPVIAQEAGFGDNIPLDLAVRQIVPDGNTVKLGDGVDGKVKVSWQGTDGWRKALEQAAAGAGYIVTVSGTEVTIARAGATVERTAAAPDKPAAVAPRPAAPKPPATPRPTQRPQQQAPRPAQVEMPVVSGGGFVLIPRAAGNAGQGGWTEYDPKGNASGPAPVPAAPPAAKWVVRAGDDLNTVLSEWSSKAEWRLVWESEYRYELTSAAQFQGDFVTAATELLRSMQDARPVVTAQFYQGNKVLVIGNNNLDETN